MRRSSVSMIPVAASCRATARIGTAAASATGTWIRKIDCQETSSVRMPPTAGPSAAPVAPALAQIDRRPALGADRRRQQLQRRGDRGGAAERLHAAGDDQGRELVGEAAGEAGAGEDRQPDGGGPPGADAAGEQRRRHRRQRHHQVEGDQHPGDPGDAGVEFAVDLRQRQDDDRGVGEDERRPPAPARRRGAAARRSSVAQLLRVLVAVLVALLQHLFDVGAGFREGDLRRRSGPPRPTRRRCRGRRCRRRAPPPRRRRSGRAVRAAGRCRSGC